MRSINGGMKNRIKSPAPYFLISRHIKQIFLYLCKINNDELETFLEADLSFWNTKICCFHLGVTAAKP